MHLLLITPIFTPAAGGAATYYGLLAHKLIASGIANKVTIITERMPSLWSREILLDGQIQIIRIFPHRAGGSVSKLAQYAKYAIQNLQYMALAWMVIELKPDIVLVHSSFHNFINLLTPVLSYIGKQVPVIADVRDHQLPVGRLKQLENYHALIACSLNVLGHISMRESLIGRTEHIPVIQENLEPRKYAIQTLEKYSLNQVPYLLFAGLIKPDKGIDLLLSTYELLKSRGRGEKLVLVGLAKDLMLLSRALSIPGVRYLGPVSRDELLDLMSCSRMVINLSGSEGMPRTSLEAIALGVRVIAPSGIPEFERYCPDSVACSSNPELVASQIENLLSKPMQNEYPIGQHATDAVLIQYERLFEKVCSEFRRGVDK